MVAGRNRVAGTGNPPLQPSFLGYYSKFRPLPIQKGEKMDITKTINGMKKEPGFADNAGMVLVHDGIVRGWSRKDRSNVEYIDVSPDNEKIEIIRKEFENKPGIYKIVVEAKSGRLEPGDALLFIIVAGDIRENVKPVLSDLLDRIKSEAVKKTEVSS
jgi:molybdopterin synthase catalytic subunit